MPKLLILNDDANFLYILKILLEIKGYTVQTLQNADDVFSEVSTFKPDLLIMDVMLEDADGRAICQQLRARGENNQLGILLTSDSTIHLADYKMCMADDYIEKPFDIYRFEEKVESMLTWLPTRTEAYAPS